jgi:hypothetical protein
MISIFNGRTRALGSGDSAQVYVQVSVSLRQYLHLFKGSSLSVFLCIALHADEKGWAFPKVETICSETGKNRETVQNCLAYLRTLTIDGHRILLSYQPIGSQNKFETNRYLLFPSPEEVAFYAGKEGPTVPDLPTPEIPSTEKPTPESSTPETPATKYSQSQEEPSLTRTRAKENRPQTSDGAENLEKLLTELEALAIYNGINIRAEAVKADRWCSRNGRKFTQRFFENWLNKIEQSLVVPAAETGPIPQLQPEPKPSPKKVQRMAILSEVGKLFDA